MDEVTRFLSKMFPREEQWAMSAADNIPGMSLPEYHPQMSKIPTVEPEEETGTLTLGATDSPSANEVADLIQALLGNIQKPQMARPDNLANALDKLLGITTELKVKAQSDMFKGAVLKTVAAASDFFDKAVGIAAGSINNLNDKYKIAKQNYENQMDALDNQVLYIKHQLADRFNKTVQTNIMNMAAKNLRVTSGNVLELTKDMAQEMTEDMREAESNAELKKIALRAGKDQAKEATRYAEKQTWTNLIGSAVKLGLAVETGGGTGESWGNLYSGYKMSKAIKSQSFNELY